MRLATLAFLAVIGSAAALPMPAAAQWLGPTLDAQRYDNLRRHQQRIRAERLKQSPSSRHARACARRYPSYNPRTDRYVVRRGVTARCRL
ncbi:BA14K family protein [Sphingomonas cannabina]|uniref:BA14K family protein n=1 Tax=Sphingomonas cannabina TaxID=2899123 RepID=UPI001F2CF043|nr:BA14K family protein [Sphingomonas cannabina]UIJ46123.1 BA14K family protein [Sphingomonas cannabina]